MTDPSPPPESTAEVVSDRVGKAVLAAIERLAVVVDEDGEIITVTDALATRFETEAEALVGQPVATLFDGDSFPAPPATEPRTLTPADGAVAVEVQSRRLPESSGTRPLIGLFITPAAASDTDALDMVGDRFRQLFESVNDAILVVDTDDNRITECNARACELLGYSREELLSMEPREIHPHDYDAFTDFVADVTEHGQGWTDDLSCYTGDDEVIPAEISATVVTLDGTEQLLASIRDISTRVEQAELLGRQSAAMQAATDGIAIYDDGTVSYANAAYVDLFGYDATEVITDCEWADLHAESDRFALDIEPALSTDGEWRGELTATGKRDAELPIEVSLTQLQTGEVLCVAHDISDQREHEQQLTGLATASRELLAAADHGEVAAATIDTIEDVLGYDLSCLWWYDSDDNALQRTAISEAAAALIEEEVAYDCNRSRAGEAYRHDQTIRNEPGDDAYAGGSRADLHVPLGGYGVVTLLDPEGSFSDQTVQLVELFAESVRAAFIRADREQQLRERQTELERRTDELTVATQFNSLVSDLIRSLLTTARGDIETLVCDRLAESPLYEGAWIATVDADGDAASVTDVGDDSAVDESGGKTPTEAISVSAATINLDSFPESSAKAVATSPFGRQLVADTEAAGGYVMTRRAFDRTDDDGTGETFAGAVPIRAGPRQFGVLAVVGTDDRGFGDPVAEGLGLLGDTLGFAFSAELARSTLVADDAVEIEFAVGGPFAALSATLDCRCCYRGSADEDTDEGTYRIEFVGADAAAVDAELAELPRVQEYRLLRETAAGCLFALTVDTPSPALLAEVGVNLRSLVAEDGEVRLVIEAPEDTDIAGLQATLADHYERAELVSKEHGRSDRLAAGYDELLETNLTERQRAVIERADELGYFAWPREATAEDVADDLDISSATFHQHLRAAEGKLVTAFLDVDA
jgi:PAS domain S-box-containing protein